MFSVLLITTAKKTNPTTMRQTGKELFSNKIDILKLPIYWWLHIEISSSWFLANLHFNLFQL